MLCSSRRDRDTLCLNYICHRLKELAGKFTIRMLRFSNKMETPFVPWTPLQQFEVIFHVRDGAPGLPTSPVKCHTAAVSLFSREYYFANFGPDVVPQFYVRTSLLGCLCHLIVKFQRQLHKFQL